MKQFIKTGTILITGASSGIGEACALHLDKLGFRVFAGVRKAADGESLKQKASQNLTPVMIDVTDPATIQSAFETVDQAVGHAGLIGLVNNAGLAVAGPLEFLPITELRKQFEVNVFGHFAVTQAFLPLLRKARGRIVNMSSISGRIAEPIMGPYAASKFALEALSDSFRIELLPWGIGVSVIQPGGVDTPIWEKTMNNTRQLTNNLPPEGRRLYDPLINAMFDISKKLQEMLIPTTVVAKAVTHALTAKRPKTRYLLGNDAKLKAALVRFLPPYLLDRLYLRLLGVPKCKTK
jgi:NAD(P)-dependent dehydrogenase (short-subunit alcohol dehydrogenase family)